MAEGKKWPKEKMADDPRSFKKHQRLSNQMILIKLIQRLNPISLKKNFSPKC